MPKDSTDESGDHRLIHRTAAVPVDDEDWEYAVLLDGMAVRHEAAYDDAVQFRQKRDARDLLLLIKMSEEGVDAMLAEEQPPNNEAVRIATLEGIYEGERGGPLYVLDGSEHHEVELVQREVNRIVE